MLTRLQPKLLALLRVPEQPDPPPGAGDSLETFRASRRYFHYRVLTWIPKQIAAFVGLLFSLAFFGFLDQPFVEAAGLDAVLGVLQKVRIPFAGAAFRLSAVFTFFEALAIVTWAAQLIFTGVLLELSWKMRWYMLGETSLRIRRGLWSLREQTMTIANIQNMIVRQGPVQRLFGIADLEVHTAGGGASSSEDGDSAEAKQSLHIGHFRGVEDAGALRDKIRARLVKLGGTGLGDHAELSTRPAGGSRDDGRRLAAAQELRAEAAALRRALAGSGAD